MFASPRGGSQFWKDLVKARPLFLANVKFVVGDGLSVRFWLDWWCGDSHLSVSFPTLFSYCPNPDISIAELSVNNWDLDFRRSLYPIEFEEWHRLSALFPTLSENGTRWCGLTPPLVASRLNLFIVILLVDLPPTDFLSSGGPAFPRKLRYSFGKILEAVC